MTIDQSEGAGGPPPAHSGVATVQALGRAVAHEVSKAIVGHDTVVQLATVALLAGGHVLLEGPPGTAKTLLANSFARATGLDFGRIQFTPDLMPGDIIGSNLFNFQTSSFTLTRGPIFTEILLADEINRTPPKTQAALLQAMQERRVTIDGDSHILSPRFTVIATQNPIEQHGVYPLPEAQLDRFLFKVDVGYPSAEEERAIVARHGRLFRGADTDTFGLRPVVDAAGIEAAIAAIAQVRIADEVVDYIVRLVRSTREAPSLSGGASPRAATVIARGAAALAALEGRDYVIPDDVQRLALPALRHRVQLSPSAEIEGRTTDATITDLISATDVPR